VVDASLVIYKAAPWEAWLLQSGWLSVDR